MSYYYGFKPYVSVAQRRANAVREMAKLAKKGRVIAPIKLAGKKIATTFWGKAWCDNLESYSDFSNRLPRGRTYVRNGSVVDLQIEAGRVKAVVSGSELYDVEIGINPLKGEAWSGLKRQCGGKIGSLVELLQGRLSQGVMELVTNAHGGLFPKPAEIKMECSCPDGAYMCKHVAAVLYGVGAMLDQKPELLFSLRKVDHLELIAAATAPTIATTDASRHTIAADDLADVFGIEMETMADVPAPAKPARPVASVPPAASAPLKNVRKIRRRAIEATQDRKSRRPKNTPLVPVAKVVKQTGRISPVKLGARQKKKRTLEQVS
jgi:uncharacterized Zn finger protein